MPCVCARKFARSTIDFKKQEIPDSQISAQNIMLVLALTPWPHRWKKRMENTKTGQNTTTFTATPNTIFSHQQLHEVFCFAFSLLPHCCTGQYPGSGFRPSVVAALRKNFDSGVWDEERVWCPGSTVGLNGHVPNGPEHDIICRDAIFDGPSCRGDIWGLIDPPLRGVIY